MSLACAPIRDLLSDHFDGRFLPGSPEHGRIEAHLESCPACRGILADYALLKQAVAPGSETVRDPAAFSRRLRTRLPGRLRAGLSLWRPLAAAAALLLAFGTGWNLKPSGGLAVPTARPPSPRPSATPVAAATPRPPVPAALTPVSVFDPLPGIPPEPENPSWLGLSFRPLGSELATYLGLPASTPGVVVGTVVPGSPAANAGLRSGDVLLTIDEIPVDVRSVRAAIREVPAGRILSLGIMRPGMSRVTIGVKGTQAR